MKLTRIAMMMMLVVFTLACAMDQVDSGDMDETGVDRDALFRTDEGGLPAADVRLDGRDPVPEPATCVPDASEEADGFFNLILLRYAMQEIGDDVISSTNAQFEENDVDFELRWASGARPLECGYDCFRPPGMRDTQHTDWPNTCYAGTTGTIHFYLDLDYGFSRDIYVSVDFSFFCVDPGQDGGGQMSLRQAAPRIHIEGGGFWEGALDFFTPGSLSDYIDARVNEHLPTLSGSVTSLDSRCETLGTIRNYPDDDHANNDAVIWDIPESDLFDRSDFDRGAFDGADEFAP